ncbi:hypothetical protein [Lujinxingia litoralis]|nr:hypothetical protein [Lujinxingia litoralis]
MSAVKQDQALRPDVPQRFFEAIEGWAERLDTKNAELRRRIDALCEHYPSAERLAGELVTIEGSDARFVQRLQRQDWEEVWASMGKVWRARLETGEAQRWAWNPAREAWSEVGEEVAFRQDASPTSALIEALVVEPGEVSYPIIFSHDVEENHRAIARAAAMWLSKAAALQVAEALGGTRPEFEPCPRLEEAQAVGPERELMRQIDDFLTLDQAAHQVYRVHGRRRAPVEVRELREPGGGRLKLVVERAHLRLRQVRQARSAVVRKRHHVFVDPSPEETHDRYFASEEALDRAVESWLLAQLDQGYRVFEEHIEGA